MGSLGSVSFLIETSSTSCSSLRQRRVSCWKRPHFIAIYGRNTLDSNGVVCKMGSFRVPKGEILRRVLGAAGRSESIEGEGEGRGGNEGEVADDMLRATIKQSKEVLARQKDLLRQIEERRKLVSSIKNSSANIEIDVSSSNESDSYFQNMNRSLASADGKYRCPLDSEKTDESDILYDNETENSSPDKHSVADALGLLRETGPEVSHSEITSPSLLEVSAPYLIKEESFEDLKEADIEGANVKLDGTPEEGIKDSPPLAGANVMNIILVAAECVPWSKTGNGILQLYGNSYSLCSS